MSTQCKGGLVLILTTIFLGIQLTLAGPFDVLTARFSGTSQSQHAIVFGAGVYVAVGAGGTILTSRDSVTWLPQTSGTTNGLNGVKYGNNGFIAVGDSSTILISVDGFNWFQCVSPVANTLSAVTYGAGRYVAVGTSGAIVTSTNGVNWSSINTGAPYNFNGVDYAQDESDLFVLVGDSGTIMTSSDGLAWTSRSSGTFFGLNAVSITQSLNWEGFLMVAVGDSGTLETSSDGITWTVVTSGTSANLLAVCNDAIDSHSPFNVLPHFGAVGQDGVFLIGNGSTWNSQASDAAANLNGILYARGNFVAVGDAGLVDAGIPWLPCSLQTTQSFNSLTSCGGSFFAVGDGSSNSVIVQSTNGHDWTTVYNGSVVSLGGVIYGTNGFMAVAQDGSVLTSSNGLVWTASNIAASSSTLFGAAAYGNGLYLATASISSGYPIRRVEPIVYCSTNGMNWSGPYALNYGINAITFAKNIFVGVGDGASIQTSPDGTNWKTQAYFGSNLSAIGFWNGQFVAGGNGVFTSTDGTNWASVNNEFLQSMTYGDQGFVALYGAGDGLVDISFSPDGTNWESRGFDGPSSGVAFGNGTYVVAGDGLSQVVPTNSQAKPLLSGQMVNQGFKLSALSQPNYSYHIQSCTNLVGTNGWLNLYGYTSTQTVTTVTDSIPAGRLQAFYRIVSP